MVKTSPHLYAEFNQFAGTDAQRATDLLAMIEDKSVRAILCARGGYGTVRLLDLVNFRKLQLNPKWIVGFSDITVLHSYLNGWYGIETIHATMPINFPNDIKGNDSIDSLLRLLTGENPTYTVEPHPFNRMGKAEGVLAGGNLSIIASLAGTDADINAQNKILFIEDIDEYLYHIDRMMMNLKRSGKLKSIAGLVVGSFTDMKDNQTPFGQNAYEIISDIAREYDFPVCFGFPAGHSEPNLALIMGRKVTLKVGETGATLAFERSSNVQTFDSHEEF